MTTQALMSNLQHPDDSVRYRAFATISSSFSVELVAPLAARASPDNPDIEGLFCRLLQNMPPHIALPHLKRLVHSPNSRTRKDALNALSQIDIGHQVPLLVEFLKHDQQEIVLFALEQLSANKKDVAVADIAQLLESEQEEIAAAAFEALEKMDSSRSTPYLVALVQANEVRVQVAALNALGKMTSFERWRSFLEPIKSESAEVRRAAVASLARKAERKAARYLMPLLRAEQEPDILRLVVGSLAMWPTRTLCAELIYMAASHAERDIRQAADWVLEEFSAALLTQGLSAALKRANEQQIIYVLSKMGRRQLPGCGRAIAAYLEPSQASSVRVTAIEALGYFGDESFLAAITPLIRSAEPMEAYMATVSACQVASQIDRIPELMRMLASSEPDHDVLKQVILQYLADSDKYDHGNPDLHAILKANLEEGNINIRYYSVMLLGRLGSAEMVSELSALALYETEQNIRNAALDALEDVLGGDVSYFLQRLESGRYPRMVLGNLLAVLGRLSWNQSNAKGALEFFAQFYADSDDEALETVLMAIAQKVFALHPDGVREYVVSCRVVNVWRYCLARVWLDSMTLLARRERIDWRRLLLDPDARIVTDAAAVAVRAKAQWVVGLILRRLYRQCGENLARKLRQAVRTILEL